MQRSTILVAGAAVAVVAVGLGVFAFIGPTASPVAAPQEGTAASAEAQQAPAPEQAAETSAQPDPAKMKQLRGTDGADTIIGTDEDEILDGGAGDDVLEGGGGNDRIYAAQPDDPQGVDRVSGGPGDDLIYADAGDQVDGGPGHDQLIARGQAPFNVKLASISIEETWGGPGDDVFDGSGMQTALTLRGGAGNDHLIGGEAGDRLFGGDGDDLLEGGPGDDILKGEAGTDTLTGGPGADFFSYAEFDGSTDIITDYNAAEGDTVSGASFKMSGADTLLYDANQNNIFILKNYDGRTLGVTPPK